MDARDRAVGALLGLAVGDAVGTTLEFERPGSFEPIDDMVGGGPFRLRPGQWTDDTSMALCLAESLLDTGTMDLADQLRRYLLWWREGYLSSTGRCFDIGGTTRTQLARFERTGEPIDPRVDEDAAANGSLMRLAAVPIRWHADVVEAAAMSGESSRSTHTAARPVDACRLMGAIVAALIQGRSWDDAMAPAAWQFGLLHPEVQAIADGSWRTKEPPAIRGSGYCVDALEAALWAVDGADDFRAAVLRAANLGDDADTTAAIAGQLAGARWGLADIPEAWRHRVTLGERIEAMAEALFDAGADDERPWSFDPAIHAWWVEPGRVLAGEYPGHPTPARAATKVGLLLDAGVRTFIDLTEVAELEPYEPHVVAAAEHRRLDLRYERHPIPDQGTLADVDAYRPIVAAIESGAERGVVFVHCWGGVGRTGTVVGCLLREGGTPDADIDARLRQLRAGTRKARRACPENGAQRDVIRDWAPAT